jgi:hyperosmotically inducible protein
MFQALRPLCRTLLAGSAVFIVGAIAQEPAASPQADNTKMNKRDRKTSEPTADQAKNNSSDRETMRKIRRALMDDKSLSTYGHNVKIIAQGGHVTLRGPVHSDDEKIAIESKAKEIAGADNVSSELMVKADKSGAAGRSK